MTFEGASGPLKSLNLDYWPWIEHIPAKVAEIPNYGQMWPKSPILATFVHHLGQIGHFSAKISDFGWKWHFSGIGRKTTLKMTKMALRHRFFPNTRMGWNKIHFVFYIFCPPVYLNRMSDSQKPIKTGSKCQKIAENNGKMDPFYRYFDPKMTLFFDP